MTDTSSVSEGNAGTERATFGGGCFWCTEAVFSQVRGVVDVQSGYAGGNVANPTYEQVCSDTTGHAEVVQVTYNPAEIDYRQLLEVFFLTHDPTTADRQGADYGRQYRSIILYHDGKQKKVAEEMLAQLNGEHLFDDPIVTQIVPLQAFFKAEEYHQRYFEKNPDKPYCRIVINPKLSKFRKKFAEKELLAK